jgi:predicted choloylglycine hydrolase
MQLKGTRRERALQHGQFVASLSKEDREKLAFTPLSKKNQTLIKRAMPKFPSVGRMIARAYEAFVLGRFIGMPREYKDRLEPFARASGLSLKTIWLSLYQPDFLMLLASSTGERTRNKFLQGMPGCSTLSVEFENEIYFLRNLDYPAAGHWEKFPTVFYHEPSEPEFQKYVSVSSLGIDTAGLTGWNESGICFSLHAHFAKKIALHGSPIFFLGEEILERAKTLDEAIAIAEKFKTIGSWAVNLTSFSEKRSVCLELSGGETAILKSHQGVLAHANEFVAGNFQADSIHFNTSVHQDSVARRESLEEAGKLLTKNFTWPKALAAIASHVDTITKALRVFGNAPSVVTTIQSIGFDPKTQCIYLSNRNETPTSLGPYVKLPFRYEDLAREFPTGAVSDTVASAAAGASVAAHAENTSLVSPDLNYSDVFLKALHFYYLAYVSWSVDGEDAKHAHGHLVNATEILPSDPHLQMQRGYFELMLNHSDAAFECFDRALCETLSPNLFSVAQYFRGCCLDLMMKREAAIAEYEAVLRAPEVDPKLAKKANHRLTQPYAIRHSAAISPDLQFAEPIDYR